MLKLSHKRPRAGEDGARGLVGIPSYVLGFLLAQVLSGAGFAACLCLSGLLGLVVVLGADDDCFYYHSWRNNVVIAFGTLSS